MQKKEEKVIVKTFACLKSEMKQVVGCRLFLFSCLIVVLLEFTAGFYLQNPESEISVFEVIFSIPREQIQQNVNLSAEAAFFSGVGSWLTLFAPIVVSLPFCALYRDETSTGYKRFRISRMGKRTYCFVKIITNFLLGALTLTLGTIFFGMLVSLMFPHIQTYPQGEVAVFLQNIGGISIGEKVTRQLLVLFLYGGFWGSVVLGFCGFIHNKYLIVGIPFMLKYIWREVAYKHGADQKFGPDTFLLLCNGEGQDTSIFYIGYLLIWICCIVLFCVSVNGKEDIGV